MADRAAIERLLLDHVNRCAEEEAPAVAHRFPVGRSGAVVDVAIAADEFIGVLIRGDDDQLDVLTDELAVCRRYFDRVLAVVDPRHLEAALACDRHGAALWSVGAGEVLIEHSEGELARVGVAALFDLMPPETRARLIRPLIPSGTTYDRGTAALSPIHIRAAFASAMHGHFKPVHSVT